MNDGRLERCDGEDRLVTGIVSGGSPHQAPSTPVGGIPATLSRTLTLSSELGIRILRDHDGAKSGEA